MHEINNNLHGVIRVTISKRNADSQRTKKTVDEQTTEVQHFLNARVTRFIRRYGLSRVPR